MHEPSSAGGEINPLSNRGAGGRRNRQPEADIVYLTYEESASGSAAAAAAIEWEQVNGELSTGDVDLG